MVKRYLDKPVIIAAIILIFIIYNPLFNTEIKDNFYSLYDKNEICSLKGIIDYSPVICAGKRYYQTKIKAEELEYKNGIRAQSKGLISVMIPSSLVEAFFPGKLYSSSKSGKNHIFETGGIYTFKGRYKNNIFYTEECTDCTWPENLNGKIYRFRALCRLQFKRLMYAWGKAGGLILALLCGSKEYLEDSTSQYFKNAGLSHILALSGMHLSLFSGIAMFIGKKAKRKKLSFVIRIIALHLFVWFAGLSPSLFRAYLCSMILLSAAILSIPDPDMLAVICLSFIIQINICPYDIYNIALILSYSALAGIILFSKYFSSLYIKKLPLYASSSLGTSTAAQVFTMPVSLKVFGMYNPFSIFAASFVSPLITVFIYLSLILILLSLIFPFISVYSGFFMNFLYTIIKGFVSFFSILPSWSIS